MTDTLYHSRPLNLRYVVWQRAEGQAPELPRTHRTATASWLYINRRHGIDAVGPMPDWSQRNDLVATGRSAPRRADDPALDGIGLWQQADEHARRYRPDQPTCAHLVGSLPDDGTIDSWRDLIEGFCKDHLSSQGMVTDWAIHHRETADAQPGIRPHWHGIVTMRAFDPAQDDCGRVRQNWLRSAKTRKRLAELWWATSGIYPIGHELASRRFTAPVGSIGLNIIPLQTAAA